MFDRRIDNGVTFGSPQIAPQLMPMGELTYLIACANCKNRPQYGYSNLNNGKCDRCRREIESGFEMDIKKEADEVTLSLALEHFQRERENLLVRLRHERKKVLVLQTKLEAVRKRDRAAEEYRGRLADEIQKRIELAELAISLEDENRRLRDKIAEVLG